MVQNTVHFPFARCTQGYLSSYPPLFLFSTPSASFSASDVVRKAETSWVYACRSCTHRSCSRRWVHYVSWRSKLQACVLVLNEIWRNWSGKERRFLARQQQQTNRTCAQRAINMHQYANVLEFVHALVRIYLRNTARRRRACEALAASTSFFQRRRVCSSCHLRADWTCCHYSNSTLDLRRARSGGLTCGSEVGRPTAHSCGWCVLLVVCMCDVRSCLVRAEFRADAPTYPRVLPRVFSTQSVRPRERLHQSGALVVEQPTTVLAPSSLHLLQY